MTTKLSAEIIHGLPGAETSTYFYVRPVPREMVPFKGICIDAWAAYLEVQVKVCGDWFMKTARVSDYPRDTIEEAVSDMLASVQRWLEPGMALVNPHLVVDKFPAGEQVVNTNTQHDEIPVATTASKQPKTSSIVQFKFTNPSAVPGAGTHKIITVVELDGDDMRWCEYLECESPFVVEVATGTGPDAEYFGLYDLDGDEIENHPQGTWGPVNESRVPAVVIDTIKKAWSVGTVTIEQIDSSGKVML